MRQRNIPVTQKVGAQVQTEVQFVHDQAYTQPLNPNLLSDQTLYNTSGLYNSLTSSSLLHLLSSQIKALRTSNLKGSQQPQNLQRRIQWLQKQIQGLSKRGLNYRVENGTTDYYSIINDLQAKYDKQLIINSNSQIKIKKLTRRVEQLQDQINSLNLVLNQQVNLREQNQKLKDSFLSIYDILKDSRKVRDIQSVFTRQIIPLVNQYQVKYDDILKKTTLSGRISPDPKNKLKTQINAYLRNLDKLIKSNSDQLNKQNIQKFTLSFLKQIDISLNQSSIFRSDGKPYKHLYQDLRQKYAAAASLYKTKLHNIASSYPQLNIKQFIQGDQFKRLAQQGIIISEDAKFITVPIYSQGLSYTQDKKTKAAITLLGREFNKILKIYPKLKDHLSSCLLQFLTTQVFDESIQLEDLQRLIEIVKYKPQIIRVDNVYSINQQKNLRQIFHLRIFVKTLLEELMKIKTKTGIILEIDEGILGMINSQIKDLCDPEDVLRVFRTLPKILQVQKIVQRDLGKYDVLTQGYPIIVEKPVFIDRKIQVPMIVKQNVPVVVQKSVPMKQVEQVPIYLTQQKLVHVDVMRQTVIERIVDKNTIQQIECKKQIPVHQNQICEVQKVVIQQRVVQIQKQCPVQIPVSTNSIQIRVVQVQRLQERLVPVIQQTQKIKQVKINIPYRVEQTKYVQVQNIKNNFIYIPQAKQIIRQVPCYIQNIVEKPVTVYQTIQKIVTVTTTQQILKQVEVEKQICIIHQKPVPYKQEVCHFIKGDKQQIIVQVQKQIQVPLIQQKLILQNVQIQKVVPLQHRVQVPVIVELNLPYIQYQPQIITCQVQKIVPYKQTQPYEVIRQIPVPIIIQKQVIKPIRCIVQKIIQKIVQVPRVVQIQKIVEKIVVVPRIIEHIITVPQIIQIPVQRQIQILKIVQIQKSYPVYITKQVIKPVPEKVQIPITNTVYKIVQKDKLITLKQLKEIVKQVLIQKRIPYEVIHPHPVQIFIQKIVQRVIQINNLQIKDKQVLLPYKHEIPVQIIQQKAIPVKKIIQNILQIPQILTKPCVLYETKTVPQIVEIIIQKMVQKIQQVVFTDIKHLVETQTKQIQITKQIIVQLNKIQRQLQPEPYLVQKIVYINNIQEQGVQVKCQKPVFMKNDILIPLQKPVIYKQQRQIPRNIVNNHMIEMHDMVERIKIVQVQGPQKIISVQTIKPQVVKLTEQVTQILNQEIQKWIQKNVAYKQQVIRQIQVPGKTQIAKQLFTRHIDVPTDLFVEKVVERITLLPQIVQVTKHHYQITQQRNLNLLIQGDVEIHRKTWLGLLCQLQKILQNQLKTLKSSTQTTDVKQQIILIQKLLELIVKFIEFPPIIQVQKQIQKIVQKQKIVTINLDSQAKQRQIAANTLIQKLINEIRRIKRQYNIDLQLDEDLKNIFISDLKMNQKLEDKLKLFSEAVLSRFRSLGNWTQQHSNMLQGFLQQRFLMAAILKQANQSIQNLRQSTERSSYNEQKLKQTITRLNIDNIGLKNTLHQISSNVHKMLNDSTTQQRSQLQRRMRNVLQTTNLKNILQQSHSSGSHIHDQVDKLKNIVRTLQSELQSYRGGESHRNAYLNQQLRKVKIQSQMLQSAYQNSKIEIQKHKSSFFQSENIFQSPKYQGSSQFQSPQYQAQQLSINKIQSAVTKVAESDSKVRQLQQLKQKQYELKQIQSQLKQSQSKYLDIQSKYKETIKQKQSLLKQLSQARLKINQQNEQYNRMRQNYNKISQQLIKQRNSKNTKSMVNTQQQQKLRSIIKQQEIIIRNLENRIKQLQALLNKVNIQNNRRSLQLEQYKRRILDSQITGPDYRSSIVPPRQSNDQYQGRNTAQQRFQSPEIRQNMRFNTPADQLRFSSPQFPQQYNRQNRGQLRNQLQQIQSSSSRVSVLTSQQNIQALRRNPTLRLLLNQKSLNENLIAQIIIKLIERIQQETAQRRFYFYSPDNITLLNYSPQSLDQIRIRLGDPIDRAQQYSRIYLSPEILRGEAPSQKSCVFNIGIIWDELLHNETYFRNSNEIESTSYEFKVRNNRLNPIFKNTLFQMLTKDQKRRLEFNEIKRRLSLQKFISIQQSVIRTQYIPSVRRSQQQQERKDN